MPTAKIAALTSAAAPRANATSASPAGIETKNATSCNQPRSRGFGERRRFTTATIDLAGADGTALPQPGKHVPGDLFDLRIPAGEAVRPVRRSRRDHRRAGLVRVRTQHRVAVADALDRV